MNKKTEIWLSIAIVVIGIAFINATIAHGQIIQMIAHGVGIVLNFVMLAILTVLNEAFRVVGPPLEKALVPFASWLLCWAIGLYVLFKILSRMFDGMKNPSSGKKKAGGH